MGKAYVVTSGKGGVGKTTVAANLGAALALNGKRTLLIDADTGLRNLDIALGLEGGIVYDLADVLEGNCEAHRAVLSHEGIDNLFFIPAAQTRDKSSVTPVQLRNLIEKLSPEYDFIFIDCPPGIDRGFESAVASADAAIIVTAPEASALRDADRVLGLLEKEETAEQLLVINRFRPGLVRRGLAPDVEDIMETLSINLLGTVPEDDTITASVNTASMAVTDPKSEAGHAFRNMAARLCGEKVEMIKFKRRESLYEKLVWRQAGKKI